MNERRNHASVIEALECAEEDYLTLAQLYEQYASNKPERQREANLAESAKYRALAERTTELLRRYRSE